ERREVATDDLVGLVPLDPLGAQVPRGDVTGGVEHEDGVVADALDQETEAFVGSAVVLPRLGHDATVPASADIDACSGACGPLGLWPFSRAGRRYICIDRGFGNAGESRGRRRGGGDGHRRLRERILGRWVWDRTD